MHDKSGQFRAVLVVFVVFCYILTSLRCLVRATYTKIGADDIFAVLALLAFTGLCGDLFYGIQDGGIGKHIYDLPVSTLEIGLKTFLVAELLYVAATALIKIAFSLTILRILDRRIHRVASYISYAVIVVVSIQAVVFFFLPLFLCKPVSYQWEQVDPAHKGKGRCVTSEETMATSYAHGAVICICDTTLAILPSYLIWTLPLHRKTKIAAGILLGLGGITAIVTLARFAYIHHLKEADTLYVNIELSILAIVEVGVSIMATSAGTLRPLFVRIGLLPASEESPIPDSFATVQSDGAAEHGKEAHGASKDRVDKSDAHVAQT